MRDLTNAVAAELIKCCGLPVARYAMIGTAIATAVLSAPLSASPSGLHSDIVETTLQTVPFIQVGSILVGIVMASSEYAGCQMQTTRTAMPRVSVLLTGKVCAYVIMQSMATAVALGAGVVATTTTQAVRDSGPTAPITWWSLAGAGVYLVLIGLMGLALAVACRALIPSLVIMLSLVLIVSPLLSSLTDEARYLPDRAGSLLYLHDTDPVLGPTTGALTLLTWLIIVGVVAAGSHALRDA